MDSDWYGIHSSLARSVQSSLPAFGTSLRVLWEIVSLFFILGLSVLAPVPSSCPPPPQCKVMCCKTVNNRRKCLCFFLSLVPFGEEDQYYLRACHTTSICFIVFMSVCSIRWEINDYLHLYLMTLSRLHKFRKSQTRRWMEWAERWRKVSWSNLGCIPTIVWTEWGEKYDEETQTWQATFRPRIIPRTSRHHEFLPHNHGVRLETT